MMEGLSSMKVSRGLAVAVGLGAGITAWAADARALNAQLVVNEVPILTIRTSYRSLGPSQRAANAAIVLASHQAGQTVAVSRSQGTAPEWVLMLGTRRLLAITAAEAKAQASSPQELAMKWAEELNQALALDPIVLSQESSILPPDKPMTLKALGRLARKAVVQQNPPGLFTITRRLGEIIATPTGIGAGTISLAFGPYRSEAVLKVLPYAAQLPLRLEAKVVGNPAQPEDIRLAAITALRRRAGLEPGARVNFSPPTPAPIPAGSRGTVRIPVRIEANDRYPAVGEAVITVESIRTSQPQESELWYSNHPENVAFPQRLYWGSLKQDQPIRLLVHHKNVSSQPLDIAYVLANPNDGPVEVAMNMGDGPPDKNPTLVGYLAGEQFLRSWRKQSGEVLQLPGKSATLVMLRRVDPQITMSGLAKLHLLTKGAGPVTLIGEAVGANGLPVAWRLLSRAEAPWSYSQPLEAASLNWKLDGEPMHVYKPPRREESFTYEVGGRFNFIRIGEKAIPGGQNSDAALLGNFGVQYFLEGTLANPTNRPVKVDVVFEASAGYSGAIFLVDGEFLPARLLQPKQEFLIARRTLAPGGRTRISIQTIPLSGANYPATIIVRPEGINQLQGSPGFLRTSR